MILDAIPDGTYTVKVVKVVDAKHVEVVMDNGQETTLAGGATERRLFESPGQTIRSSSRSSSGTVMVYVDLTTTSLSPID